MTRNCLCCNKPMEVKRLTKKYCNDNCKQIAYLKRTNQIEPHLEYKKTDAHSDILSVTTDVKLPTVTDIILQDISAKLSQLMLLHNKENIIVKNMQQGKSVLIIQFEQ